MAFESRFVCKIDGCSNPPHRYPSGAKAAYCKEHIRFRKGKFRGEIHMTGPMSVVLSLLQAALSDDKPFIELPPDTDKRTIKALINRDWIVQSGGLDGKRYKITGRGQKAFAACEGDFNRRDGMCPRCGEHPRNVRGSGKRDAYCKACLSAVAAQKQVKYGRRVNPERGCSRCGNKPLLRYSTGMYSTYCVDCEQKRQRIKAEKRRLKELEIAHTGEGVPLCSHCHEKPVKVFANSISNYCADCIPIMTRRWKLRRVLRKIYV